MSRFQWKTIIIQSERLGCEVVAVLYWWREWFFTGYGPAQTLKLDWIVQTFAKIHNTVILQKYRKLRYFRSPWQEQRYDRFSAFKLWLMATSISALSHAPSPHAFLTDENGHYVAVLYSFFKGLLPSCTRRHFILVQPSLGLENDQILFDFSHEIPFFAVKAEKDIKISQIFWSWLAYMKFRRMHNSP